MIKTRHGMFETNSSSTHTIIVTDRKTEPGTMVDFAIGEFGWEFKTLRTVDEKASYLYTMACDILNRDVYQDLFEILSKYDIKCSCSKRPEFNKFGLDNGWVDHACDGETEAFVERMLNHDMALIKYLFSDESFVVTGNDNADEDERDWYYDQLHIDYPHKEYYKGN